MFEEKKEITVQGVVKEFQFTNPHTRWLLVDVTNKDGSVTTWGFEAEGPSTLMRNKVRKSDFPFGTKLTIHRTSDEGRPASRRSGARPFGTMAPSFTLRAGLHRRIRFP
jgi:hypothetical protein